MIYISFMSLPTIDGEKPTQFTGMKYDYDVYLVCNIGISNISDKEFVQPQNKVNGIS